jgi:hypothetical protein
VAFRIAEHPEPISDFCRANLRELRKRIVGSQAHNQGRAANLQCSKVVSLDRHGKQRAIQHLASQSIHDLSRIASGQVHRAGREDAFVESLKSLKNHGGHKAGKAEAQRRHFALVDRTSGLDDLVARADRFFREIDENQAGGRGFHSISAALEDLDTESLFEVLDLLAQRRLGNVQLLSGACEIASLSDHRDVLQQAELQQVRHARDLQ